MRVSGEYLAQRKQEIATVAMRLYCEKGPDVSVAAICQAAGIAKGTIFRYYPSRDQMFREIFDACREHARGMGRYKRSVSESDEQALKGAIRLLFAWPTQYPLEFQFVTLYTDANAFFVFEARAFDELRMNALGDGLLDDAFERMRRPELPPELAKRMLSALINTCSRYLIAEREAAAGAEAIDGLVEALYESVFVHAAR